VIAAQQPQGPVYKGKPATEWVAQLKSPDRGVREQATRALLKIGPPAVPGLVALLEGSKDTQVRLAVLHAFERLGPNAKGAVPALIVVLKTGDADERGDAVEALSRIGPGARAAIPALLEALKDQDQSVRAGSAAALGDIGGAAGRVTPALMQALTDKSDSVRSAAAASLGQLGPRARPAVQALLGAVNDSSPTVRTAAAHALKQIDTEAGNKVTLPDDDRVPKHIPTPAPPRFVKIHSFDKETGIIALRQLTVQQVPEMVEKTIEENGKPKKVREIRQKPVTVESQRNLRFDDLLFFGGDGKRLEKGKAMERLGQGGIALLAADGNEIAPVYLALVRKDALVLLVRSSAK